MSGESPPTAKDLWQPSVCADDDDASQTCARQKEAQSGAISIASSVSSAVICRLFMAMV
jgi:hypothetical protein